MSTERRVPTTHSVRGTRKARMEQGAGQETIDTAPSEGTMSACVYAVEQQIVRGEVIHSPTRTYGLQAVMDRCSQNPVFVEAVALLCTAAIDAARCQAVQIIDGVFRQALHVEALQAVSYMMNGVDQPR